MPRENGLRLALALADAELRQIEDYLAELGEIELINCAYRVRELHARIIAQQDKRGGR